MANLEGMPIGSLPEATDIQDEDEIVVYRPSTGKAYQANTDLIDSLSNFQYVAFDNTSSILDQVDALNARTITFGYILSSGNQEVCEVPANTNFHVIALKYGNPANTNLFLIRMSSTIAIYTAGRSANNWSAWYQLSASAVSTNSVGDPVVMGDED